MLLKTLALSAALLGSLSCNRVRFLLESEPPGAAVVIDNERFYGQTPAKVSLPAPGNSTFSAHCALLSGSDGKFVLGRGRIRCKNRAILGTAMFLAEAESLDGSAWTASKDWSVLRAKLPVPGSFHVVIPRGRDSPPITVDGVTSQPEEDAIYELTSGRHEIRFFASDVSIDSEEGYCIQIALLSPLYLSLVDGQLKTAIYEAEDGTSFPIKDGKEVPFKGPHRFTLRYESHSGKKCTIAYKSTYRLSLRVRVTASN